MYIIEVPNINLDQIYSSGQVFRWIKFSEGKYVILYKNMSLKIQQQRSKLIMNCSEEDFYNIWFEYFDLRTDYVDLNRKMQMLGDEFKPLAVRGRGVRILNQDLFEMLITYAIGGRTYSEIRWNIDNLCMLCGVLHRQSIRELGKLNWFEIPTAEMILNKKEEIKKSVWFKDTNANFDLLFNVCELLQNGTLTLEGLKAMPYVEMVVVLNLYGYSMNQAKAIALQTNHCLESYAETKKLTLFVEDVVGLEQDEFRKRIKKKGLLSQKGYVRQVLIYNMTNPPEGDWSQWGLYQI